MQSRIKNPTGKFSHMRPLQVIHTQLNPLRFRQPEGDRCLWIKWVGITPIKSADQRQIIVDWGEGTHSFGNGIHSNPSVGPGFVINDEKLDHPPKMLPQVPGLLVHDWTAGAGGHEQHFVSIGIDQAQEAGFGVISASQKEMQVGAGDDKFFPYQPPSG